MLRSSVSRLTNFNFFSSDNDSIIQENNLEIASSISIDSLNNFKSLLEDRFFDVDEYWRKVINPKLYIPYNLFESIQITTHDFCYIREINSYKFRR